MAIHELVVGVIECATSADHLNAIIASAGLQAHPAPQPNAFYLTSRGRATEPEIGGDLLKVVSTELNQAVDAGAIPSWTMLPDRRSLS
ncbi:MAG TPA: hypothetical protein VF132_09040 [Rudaea sp.]